MNRPVEPAYSFHQMWWDKRVDDNDGPPETRLEYQEYSSKIRELHPHYRYEFWNGRKIKALWTDPRLARWKDFCFNTLKSHIEKCDFTRLAILYTDPGDYCVYADLDFIVQKCLDPLFEGREIGLCYEPPEHYHMSKPRIYNGIILSKSRHPLWGDLMTFIMERYSELTSSLFSNAVNATGPECYETFFSTYPQKVPSNAFIDTCLLVPLYKRGVSEICAPDAVENAYAYTRWYEGTGWALENMHNTIQDAFALVYLIVAVLIVVVMLWLQM